MIYVECIAPLPLPTGTLAIHGITVRDHRLFCFVFVDKTNKRKLLLNECTQTGGPRYRKVLKNDTRLREYRLLIIVVSVTDAKCTMADGIVFAASVLTFERESVEQSFPRKTVLKQVGLHSESFYIVSIIFK